MTLSEYINGIEILRETGEPDGSRPVSLIVLSQDLRRLPEYLIKRRQLKVAHIVVPDLAPGTPVSIHLPPRHGQPEAFAGAAILAGITDSDLVFLFPGEAAVRVISMALRNVAQQKVWLAGELEAPLQKRKPVPDYYEAHAAELEQVWSLLETDADREYLARRAKTLITGDPGYLLIAPHLEYKHPVIRPAPGDTMIDGGVSDMVGAQVHFAEAVGRTGAIFGFEPIAWMAEKAASQLAIFPQYHLTAAGLAEKDGQAEFTDLRDSSFLGAAKGANVVKCDLRSIDSFAREKNIGPVQCIKLDIEGAELSALKGARETILADRPKLIICLYHKPEDLYEIPLYIRSLAPDYRFQIAHSSAGFTDTILYAAPEA